METCDKSKACENAFGGLTIRVKDGSCLKLSSVIHQEEMFKRELPSMFYLI